MLVLSRNIGTSIKIGENITVTAIDVSGNQVKLGIDAPKNIPVHREEIYLKIKEENKGK